MAVSHSRHPVVGGEIRHDADYRRRIAPKVLSPIGCIWTTTLLAFSLVSAPTAFASSGEPMPPASLMCSIVQLTNTASGTGHQVNVFPSINANGTRIAFVSDGELLLADTTNGSLTPLTEFTSGFDPFSVIGPSINAAGTRIAFTTTADPTGENPDHSLQLFLTDVNTGAFTQLTHHSSNGTVFSPLINAAGTLIAFMSNADLTGDNADRKFEIFIADATGNVTQVTNVGLVSLISIDSAGTLVAFNSDADLTGMNADHNEEIFVVNTTTGAFAQLTDTTGLDNVAPKLDGTGSSVVFVAGGDFLRLDISSGSVTQLTNFNLPAVGEYSISASGTVLIFQAYADLTGGNPDLDWELFVMDVSTGSIAQLTDMIGEFAAFQASIDAAGRHIAFVSDADLAGGNADSGYELFLATCGGDDATPPVISGMPSADCTLWPPNHKLVEVAAITATDAESGVAPESFTVSVTSNEPEDAGEKDVLITSEASGAFVLQLRAERSGQSTTRIYTLTATAADLFGNRVTATTVCAVPHDQGHGKDKRGTPARGK